MEPLYFGTAPSALFGVYHPSSSPEPARGVVLCSPLGHEYLRAHRAYRNLAISLSRAGLPVLRFDYLGSGDSGGDGTNTGVAQWLQDIDAAVDELKRLAGVTTVSLVGLRFGAALAALASARRDDVVSVVLWDPVLSGKAYLEELEAVQVGWLRDRLGAGAERLATGHEELIGLPVRAEMLQEMREVDLWHDFRPRVERLFVVISSPRDDCLKWHAAMKALGVPAGLSHVPSAGDWLNPEAVHQLLLPHEILKQVATLTIGG